jgi:hypothetical protein
MDVNGPPRETFAGNENAKPNLLSNVSDEAWRAAAPTGKGRTGIACHIHNVRLMGLAAADKTQLPAKLDEDKVTRRDVMEALTKSAVAIQKILRKGLDDPAGKVPNFKPGVVAFDGYRIAHDSHPRGQISMLARQVGYPVPPKAGFGRWEWSTLSKECAFTR